MELAGTRARSAIDAIIHGAWVLAYGLILVTAIGTSAPAAAAPSPNCPNPIPFTVPFGGSVTQDLGYCDGGLGIGIGPLQGSPPTQGTVSFSKKPGQVIDELVTYTHTGDGSVLSDTFTFNDGDGFDVTVNVTIQPPTSSIVIAPANLPPMRVGASYSTSVDASGGVGPYTFSATGTLPPGITLASNGTLSGTPTERRPSSFNVIATDSTNASAQRAYTVTPADPIYVINPVPNGTQNVAYNRTLTAGGGIAPYTVNYLSGTLPPGVAAAGATLSGTPTAAGTYNIIVRVTDSSAGTFPYQMDVPATLTINPPTVITVNPAAIPVGTVGAPYTLTLVASGGATPYTYDISVGTLPAGLSLNATSGVISGVPTEAGNFAVAARATDANNAQGTRNYTFAIGKPTLSISPTTIPVGRIGEVYSQTITASGGLAPYTYSATGLPTGLTLSTSGVLSGTPTQAGSFTPTVTATSSGTGVDSPFTESRQYTLDIADPALSLAPADPALPDATYAQAYSVNFAASGGTPGYAYTHTGTIPPGLTLSSGGVLSGTPVQPGSYTFVVTATDASTGTEAPFSIQRSYTLAVSTPTITLSPATLPSPVIGAPYTEQISAGGGASPYSFQITSGALPAGLTLQTDGSFSGAPTASGTFSFTITGRDANNQTGEQTYTVVVGSPALSVSPAAGALPTATAGASYSQTFTTSGGVTPYTFSSVGAALPAGLTLSAGGVLSGTPTATGTFSFTVEVTDSTTGTPGTATVGYVLTVASPTLGLSPASGALGDAVAGSVYTHDFSVSGGTAPYSASVTSGALPQGLTLSAAGVLSGTPIEAGNFTFTVTATDSTTGDTGQVSGSYTLSVTPPTLTMIPSAGILPSGRAGEAYSLAYTTNGGTAPYSYSLVAGSLPPGVSLSSDGLLTGTPTATGTFNLIITSRDSTGGTAGQITQPYQVTVAAPTLELSPASGVLPSGVAGTSYQTEIIGTGGTTPYTFDLVVGVLPPGVTLETDGRMIGVPTASGTYPFSVRMLDATAGGTYAVISSYLISIATPTLTLSPAAGALPGAAAGTSYSQQITASGGLSPYTYFVSAGTLPPGLSLDGSGLVSGTPTTPGIFNFSIQAEDNTAGGAGVVTQAYAINVAVPTLTITPAAGALPTATAGTAYSQTLTASGGLAPYAHAIVAGALPQGMTLSADGTLSGTPTEAGTFGITVHVTDSTSGMSATLDAVYSLTVETPLLTLMPAAGALPAGVVGNAYAQSFTATGGIAPYTYALTGTLPAGMSHQASGQLSGTPTESGTFTLTVEASDSTSGTAAVVSQAYVLNIAAPSLALTPAAGALPTVTAGTAYSQTFVASGGQAPYAYSIASGALPAGLMLSANGALAGVPTEVGTFNLSVRAVDSTAGTAAEIVQAYRLQVGAPQITVMPASLPDAQRGSPYTASFSASGGTGTYTYGVGTGALPAGITLYGTGQLTGTPTASGSFAFQIVATDALGFTGIANLVLNVEENAPDVPDATVTTQAGQDGTFVVSAVNGVAITSLAVVQQPAYGRVAINGLTLVYTPDNDFAGTDTFRYTATGPGGTSQPATVTVDVIALPVPTVPDQVVSVLAGTPVRIDATAGASGGPFTTVVVVEAPLDGTLTVDGTNLVYTAPATAEGTRQVRYTVSNAFGASAPATATITVNPLPQVQPQQRDVIAGGSVQVDLTAGAAGGPFIAASVIALTPSTAGDARVERSGQAWLLTFTPAQAFAGVATVSVTLDNAHATSAPALLTFNVTARGDPARDAEVLGLLDAQAATTRRFAVAQLGNFQQRLERLHGAGESVGRFQNGIGFQMDRSHASGRGAAGGDGVAEADMPGRRMDDAAGPRSPARDPGGASLGLWTGGMISTGDADSRTGREGFDFETTGISAGADYRLSPAFALGAGVGYGRDRTDVGVNGSRSDGDAYTMALYASWHPGRHLFVDWLAGYQLLAFENRRYVTDTGDIVSGKRDGKQWIASMAAGADFRRGQWQLSPYARLDAARARLDGYTETGIDSSHALDFERQEVDTTTVSAGLRAAWSTVVAWGRLSPQFRLEYQRELENPADAGMQYVALPGGPLYQAPVRGFERNRFVFGAGIMLAAERDLMLRMEYRGLLGDSEQSDHGLMFNLEKKY